MAALVKSGKYGDMNIIYTSKMGYYDIMFVSYSYTLKYDTTCNGNIISSGELVFKARYLSSMQENTNWYWYQEKKQQVIIVPTITIVNTCLDVVVVKYVHDIPKSIFNRNHAKQALRKHTIFMTDSDYDYILGEIEHR